MDPAARLREEHAEIRRRRAEFDDCLRVGEGLEGGPRKMVVADLVLYGWDLWEYLHNHAHRETQAVQDFVARSLPRSRAPAST